MATQTNLNPTPPVSPMNMGINLADFRDATSNLTREQKGNAIQQALFLFDFLYVHLQLKQSMHSVDPIQQLKLLLIDLGNLRTEYEFHRAMTEIFTSVRDLHTNYLLPEPFRSAIAVLPFSVDEYFDGDTPHYPVTQMWTGLVAPPFEPGVEVTHWNGVPMAVAVDNTAALHAGSNREARHLQGLRNMTVRPLAIAPMPAEDWVTVTFVHRGGVSEVRFPWKVLPATQPPHAVDPNNKASASARSLGLDLWQELVNQTRRRLLQPAEVRRDSAMMTLAGNAPARTAAAGPSTIENYTSYPAEVSYRTMATPSGTFGYLRIRTFNVENVQAFVTEIMRILLLLPQHGLILDVRSNPGGNIMAGESLLQLFTNRKITPEPLQLRNTVQTLVYSQNEFLQSYSESIRLSISTGELFSQGYSVLDSEQVNQIGRVYPGKVVLLTDAACYSTTCFFAAGFQDHEIGPILGQHESTGAGGANVWTHSLLSGFWPMQGTNPLQPLPNGMDMRIAFRRSLRVGARTGLPLEDLGVASDILVRPTRNDIFGGDVDLFARAGEVLAQLIRTGSA